MATTSKSLKSVYISLSSLLLTFVNGLFGLIITRSIVLTYGSDINGLNSTVTQFISMLLIIESGFTLATNVALFGPLSRYEITTINSILSATKNIFLKIGLAFFVIGSAFSFAYLFLLKTNVSKDVAFIFFLLTIISTSFTLSYTTKYKILLMSEQKEYILNLINIFTVLIFQSALLLFISINANILFIRLILAINVIVNGFIVAYVCKDKYKFINFNEKPDYTLIKGTSYLLVQKITSVIYSTVPIVFISATVGTIYASVYFVYSSIFTILKSIVYAFINAPRMGIGKLIVEKNRLYVLNIFYQYQLLVNIFTTTLLSVAVVLTIPFVKLYMQGAKDINYVDYHIMFLLTGIVFFELVHIPSGNIINMSGNFKTSRDMQLVACFVVIIAMIFGNKYFGFHGIIFAVLLTSILLAVLEIFYVNLIYFKSPIFNFFKLLIPSLFISIAMTYFEIKLIIVNNYINFILNGAILVLINLTVNVSVNIIFNKSIISEIYSRIKSITRRNCYKD